MKKDLNFDITESEYYDICDAYLVENAGLYVENLSEHLSGNMKLRCKYCDFISDDSFDMANHILTHTDVTKRLKSKITLRFNRLYITKPETVKYQYRWVPYAPEDYRYIGITLLTICDDEIRKIDNKEKKNWYYCEKERTWKRRQSPEVNNPTEEREKWDKLQLNLGQEKAVEWLTNIISRVANGELFYQDIKIHIRRNKSGNIVFDLHKNIATGTRGGGGG